MQDRNSAETDASATTSDASSAVVGSGLPRIVEVAAAGAGLLLIMPALLASAVAISVTSPGPVLFRQQRVGRGGNNFTLYKLRTMHIQNVGPQVTAGNDQRITAVGKLLRKSKLDEFPELWNIIKGDMSLVGPRPEVVRYVNSEDPLWRVVLKARPGLTDPVTLKLRNEEALMSQVAGDPEIYYRETLQPYKLRGYVAYLKNRTWHSDIGVLWHTVLAVIMPHRAAVPTLDELNS